MQTLNSALTSLYARLNASEGVGVVRWEEVQEWQDGALQAFLEWGILKPASAASSLECFGCEHRCYQEVIAVPYKEVTRAFIVCDMPEVQEQMGRINVPLERLSQWQCSVLQLAQVVQGMLDLTHELKPIKNGEFALGMLTGNKGRRWVTLKNKPLRIEINQTDLPIENVLYVENDTLLIDRIQIERLLNAAERVQGKCYQSSTEKQDARKSQTQGMYQDWNDAFVKLKRDNPTKSKTWCSQQIAKMDIAKERDAQTIYKNMQ